jgi:hypothetical protein
MHTINLTNAWEPPVAGARIWIRRFGRPSGIEPGDRIWLVMDVPPPAEAVLNAAPLPASAEGPPWRADVTALLGERNELLLPLDLDAVGLAARCSLPAACGGVRLEIESPA